MSSEAASAVGAAPEAAGGDLRRGPAIVPRHRPGRWWGSALGLLLVAAAAGCGVGAQGAPQALDVRAPHGGGTVGGKQTPSNVLLPWVGAAVHIYLVGNKHLAAVDRDVNAPPLVSSLLSQLALGPTQRESSHGLVSPASMLGPVGVGAVRQGVVRVDLPRSFQDLDGADQIMAVAQIVFTATSVRGVRAVRFYVAGQEAQVPETNGHLVSGPSTRADYRALEG
jgi:Sporulation and spore germination